MIMPGQADDATLMRIYSQALTHTLEAAVRAVYEQGLHDGIIAATARSQVPEAAPAPLITPGKATNAK
jgi:hypothetical protein